MYQSSLPHSPNQSITTPRHNRHLRQPQFLDAVRAKDVDTVGLWIEVGYQVLAESLLEAVRIGSLEMVKVGEWVCHGNDAQP